MQQSNTPVVTARRILTWSAWLTMLLIVIGGVLSLPDVAEQVTTAPRGSLVFWLGRFLPAAAGIVLLALWASAVAHAAQDPLPPMPRPIILTVLIIGNAVASLFYYFLYVLWNATGPTARSTADLR